MKYRILELLQCPYDGRHPLRLFPVKEIQTSEKPFENYAFDCKNYCYLRKDQKIDRTVCPSCDIREIETGILFCDACGRTYPVRDCVVSLMPDEMRDDGEIEGLDPASLPAEVAAALKNTSFKKGKIAGPDDRLSEMRKRDEESSIYDRLYPRESSLAEIEIYLAELKPEAYDLVLDAGCGTGRITVEYLPFSGDVAGVDFSLQSLKFLWERVDPELRKKLHLIQADLTMLPFREECFDKAVSTSVLCFLPTRELRAMALFQIRKSLKPGGLLVASVYNYSLLKRLMGGLHLSSTGKKEGYHSGGKIRYYNFEKDEFEKMLSNGFEVLRICGSDHRLPVLSRIHPKIAVLIDRLSSKTGLSIPVLAREMTATCRKI
jgi:SAM-dependent methyltransferase/uncharacterized protein YbaR (Trm112 family)